MTVSLSTPTTNLDLGRSRNISGTVSPEKTGTVELTIIRNGTPLTTKSLPLSDSRYSYSYKPAAQGTYTVRAEYVGDDENTGNTSPSKTFKVVR